MYSAHACIFLAVYDDTGVGLGKVIGTCLLLVGYFRRECYLIADDLIGPLGLYRYEYLGRKDELSVALFATCVGSIPSDLNTKSTAVAVLFVLVTLAGESFR